MKSSIKFNFIKIATALAITFLSISMALADSVYDGIWKIAMDPSPNAYFSITVTGNKVLVVCLYEVATYQDPLRGAYMGSLPATNNLPVSPENPLSVRVTLDEGVVKAYTEKLAPGSLFYRSWRIKFTSKDTATIGRPPEDYPNIDFPPLVSFQKVF